MGRIFAAGGIVMWPLLVFSLVAIALIIERLFFWFRLNRRQRKVMQDILRTYRQAPVEVYSKLRQNVNLPIVRIFMEALEIEGASPKQFHLALASAMQAPATPLQHRLCHHHQRRAPAGIARDNFGADHFLRCPATGRHWRKCESCHRRHQRGIGLNSGRVGGRDRDAAVRQSVSRSLQTPGGLDSGIWWTIRDSLRDALRTAATARAGGKLCTFLKNRNRSLN